jgi:chemotaxis protein MotA
LFRSLKIARREGILALEDHVDKLDSKFLTKALQMIIDGTDPEIAKRVMRIEIEALEARHAGNRGWFDTLATMGPAFWYVGYPDRSRGHAFKPGWRHLWSG